MTSSSSSDAPIKFWAVVVALSLGTIAALIPSIALTHEALLLRGVLVATIFLWLTEAIPLAATALLAPTMCVVLGIDSVRNVFRSFADPIVFLFLGGFVLVEAMSRHGLDRRIAFTVLGARWVGERPLRLYLAYGLITSTLSMWISNAATTAMMLPIGLAILKELARRQSELDQKTIAHNQLQCAPGLMLLTAFAASVGGMATPIGTPPNLIGIGLIEKTLGLKIGFLEWVRLGLPVALFLTFALVFYFFWRCPLELRLLRGSAEWLAQQKISLGSWTRPQRRVATLFLLAMTLWILPGVIAMTVERTHPIHTWISQHLPESIVAMLAACALFLVPQGTPDRHALLGWEEAVRIDWASLFLYGSGLALGELMFSTGLARWIGDGLAGVVPSHSVVSLTLLFTGVAMVVSETTSNTASATMVIPVAIAVSQSAGVDPIRPALGACLGASLGFLLPVSTPPNAIVYGSRCITLWQMIRYGACLDIFGYVTIVVAVLWWY